MATRAVGNSTTRLDCCQSASVGNAAESARCSVDWYSGRNPSRPNIARVCSVTGPANCAPRAEALRANHSNSRGSVAERSPNKTTSAARRMRRTVTTGGPRCSVSVTRPSWASTRSTLSRAVSMKPTICRSRHRCGSAAQNDLRDSNWPYGSGESIKIR